jgi:hypothetical protein
LTLASPLETRVDHVLDRRVLDGQVVHAMLGEQACGDGGRVFCMGRGMLARKERSVKNAPGVYLPRACSVVVERRLSIDGEFDGDWRSFELWRLSLEK